MYWSGKICHLSVYKSNIKQCLYCKDVLYSTSSSLQTDIHIYRWDEVTVAMTTIVGETYSESYRWHRP